MTKVPFVSKLLLLGVFYLPGFYLVFSFSNADELSAGLLAIIGGVFLTWFFYNLDSELARKIMRYI